MHPYFEMTHKKQIIDIYETLHAYYSLLKNKEFSFAVLTQKIQYKNQTEQTSKQISLFELKKKFKIKKIKIKYLNKMIIYPNLMHPV